jgi:hypothetical protein
MVMGIAIEEPIHRILGIIFQDTQRSMLIAAIIIS